MKLMSGPQFGAPGTHRAARRYSMHSAAIAIGFVLLAASSARPAQAAAPLAFNEVTFPAGLAYNGSSWTVAWSDANGDGLADLFFGNHGAMHNLFLNTGYGTFREAPAGMFNRVSADAHGAAWADFDNDGDQDLLELVGADRGGATKSNYLYVNENGVLNDHAAERGLVDPKGRGRTPLWFDWDRDGHLDVLVLNADRVDGPSALFRSSNGFFSRTNAVNFAGFTKYAVFGALEAGKQHVIVSGQPFPKRVHDANQLSPLPLTDQRVALDIPQTVDMIADTVLFDANGDGVDEILEIKGRLSSDVALVDGDVHARVVLEDTGGTRGFRFSATEPLTLHVAPLWDSWWSMADVYIGRSGWHPSEFPIKLSAATPGVDGLMTPTAAKGVYISYDRRAGKWDVRVIGKTRQEANFVINGGLVSGLQTIGFLRFARIAPTLLASRDGQFDDASVAAGLAATAVASHCFSATAADFDNDGDVDVFSACSGPIGKEGIENQLLRNDGAGRFVVVPLAAGVTREEVGIADGVAAADFDLDGFVDLALSNGQGLYPFNHGPSQLFRNRSRGAGNRNHWVQIDLRGVESNRDGVGARVRLTAGGKSQTRLQRNGVHSGSQDFARIHFGVGASTTVSSIEVQWPSGARQTLTNVPVDQVLRIVEARGATAPYLLLPATQAFGEQLVYTTSAARRFTVTNTSKLGVPVANLQLIGTHPAQFAASHRCGSYLAAGASCVVNVTFKPTVAGVKSAQLLVVAGDRFIETANLTGNATRTSDR